MNVKDRRGSETTGPALLVVDDDQGTCETLGHALLAQGFLVETAASGAEGVSRLTSRRFDLMVVDLRLPDMLGIDFLRQVNSGSRPTPFIVLSGFLTIPAAVEAMRLGAVTVLEKPVDIDVLLTTVRAGITRRRPSSDERARAAGLLDLSAAAAPPVMADPRSPVERWTSLVVKACASPSDLKTLQEWARFAGVSYTTVCETCRLLGIRPHDARDLARVLRAIVRSRRDRCHLEALLDVSDRRTLKSLLDRAGVGDGAASDSVTVEGFLASQQFVPPENDGLRLLTSVLTGAERPF